MNLEVVTVLCILHRYMNIKLCIFQSMFIPIKYKLITEQISEHPLLMKLL